MRILLSSRWVCCILSALGVSAIHAGSELTPVLEKNVQPAPFCDPLQTWFTRDSGTTRHFNAAAFGNGTWVVVGTNLSVSTSTNGGVSWTNQTIFLGSFPPLRAVAFGSNLFVSGRFVAVDDLGISHTSSNGLVWFSFGLLGVRHLSGVVFGAGNFVCVGTNGGIYLLPMTGGSTNRSLPGFSNMLASIAFGSGRFVTVGHGGAALISTNGGTNWIAGSTGISSNLTHVTFGNGLFAAVGPGGTIVTSSDGLVWTRRNSASSANFTSISYGYGRFVAASDTSPNSNDRVSISLDGITWSARPAPAPDVRHIAMGPGNALAVGSNGLILQSFFTPLVTTQPQSISNCAGRAITLTAEALSSCPMTYQWQRDGADIAGANSPTLSFPPSSMPASGLYRLLIRGATVATTAPAAVLVRPCSPLEQWQTRHSQSNAPALNSILCEGGLRVAVGNNGTALRSLDGSNWIAGTTGTNATLDAVAYGAGHLVAVGMNGVILTSPDGLNWSLRASPTNRPLQGIAFGANRFVAVGTSSTILVSSNGFDWSRVIIQTNRNLLSINWLNDTFVITTTSGFIMTSSDGLDWAQRSLGTIISAYDMAWDGKQYVGVGNSGLILTSSNAVNWTQRVSPVATPLRSIVWAHGHFVVVGDSGTLLTSTDGMNWTRRDSTTTLALNSLSYCGATLVAAGDKQLVLETTFFGPPVMSGKKTGNTFELGMTGEIGTTYRIETSEAAPGGSWNEMITFTNLEPTRVLQQTITTNAPRRFYRAVAP